MKKNSTVATKRKQIFKQPEADHRNGPGRSIHLLLRVG